MSRLPPARPTAAHAHAIEKAKMDCEMYSATQQ